MRAAPGGEACSGALQQQLPAGRWQWRRRQRAPEQRHAWAPPCRPRQARPSVQVTSTSGSTNNNSSCSSSPEQQDTSNATAAGAPVPRRAVLAASAAVAAAVGGAGMSAGPALASKLPQAVDRAWEGMGGGPADLVFPADFLGVWDVDSVLTGVELPLGPEFVPDMRVVQRAQQQDLNTVVRYQVAFLQNQRGEVVPDRSFNTASLMNTYLGGGAGSTEEVQRRIRWDPNDPNLLQMALPGGLQVSTRVTRRSEERQGPDRLATSEYFQQLIASSQQAQPKVKASQCFTKYHWRSAEAAAAAAGSGGSGGVQVVATQVVSDYLTSFDDPALMMQSGGKPVVVYTYRMAFRRAQPARAAAAAGTQQAAATATEAALT